MFNRIETLRMADALISHGTRRQRVIATNIANADTPNYQAKDVESFKASLNASAKTDMRATHVKHLTASGWGMGGSRVHRIESEPSPNGNSVSLEDEMFRIVDARREFDLALTITKSSLAMMRTSLGRRA